MDKLKEMVKKELDQIAEQGLTNTNLETTFKLVDILKDIGEIDEDKKERGEMGMPYRDNYGRGGYGRENYSMYARGNYRDSYNMPYMYDNYGRSGNGGRYQHHGCEHFFEKMDRMLDCLEEYVYSKGRYRDGGSGNKMVEDIEKTMYAVCALVESLMDSADTPEEKETIRKHIDKIKSI